MRNVFDYYEDAYLAHYGVRGQKWGIRRFQNPDGTLTDAGKAHYGAAQTTLSSSNKRSIKKEYKEDNKKAFEYGRDATISNRAAEYASKRTAKAQKRYDRRSSEKNAIKLSTAKKLQKEWEDAASKAEKQANSHRNSLIKKYGKEAVSSIKIDKKGRINEPIHKGKEYLTSTLKSVFMTAAATLLGSPVTMLWYPSSKKQAGKAAYKLSLERENLYEQAYEHKSSK